MSKVKEGRDFYLIDGKKYVRVTRVLDVISKPEFYRWYAKHGYRKCRGIMHDRAAFGTRVHKEIFNYLKGDEVWIDNEEMDESLRLFIVWAKSKGLEPFQLEFQVSSDDVMVAGTCDFVGFCDGEKLLGDWKTSKALYDNYYLQVSSYLVMYEKQMGEELDGAFILSIRDGKVHFDKIYREECYRLWDVFCSARKIYKWKYGV